MIKINKAKVMCTDTMYYQVNYSINTNINIRPCKWVNIKNNHLWIMLFNEESFYIFNTDFKLSEIVRKDKSCIDISKLDKSLVRMIEKLAEKELKSLKNIYKFISCNKND